MTPPPAAMLPMTRPVTVASLGPDLRQLAEGLNRALPSRIYGSTAIDDIQNLALLSRTLLCLNQTALRQLRPHAPRFFKGLELLVCGPWWLDALYTNATLLPLALPMLCVLQLEGQEVTSSLLTLKRLLADGHLERNEWSDLQLYEQLLHLQQLGIGRGNELQSVRQRLEVLEHAPRWLWCLEEPHPLHFMLSLGRGAGEQPPARWGDVTEFHLVVALRTRASALAISEHVLAQLLSRKISPFVDMALTLYAQEHFEAPSEGWATARLNVNLIAIQHARCAGGQV